MSTSHQSFELCRTTTTTTAMEKKNKKKLTSTRYKLHRNVFFYVFVYFTDTNAIGAHRKKTTSTHSQVEQLTGVAWTTDELLRPRWAYTHAINSYVLNLYDMLLTLSNAKKWFYIPMPSDGIGSLNTLYISSTHNAHGNTHILYLGTLKRSSIAHYHAIKKCVWHRRRVSNLFYVYNIIGKKRICTIMVLLHIFFFLKQFCYMPVYVCLNGAV